MAKALFRFLRGELNGFYITSLYDTLNRVTQDIKDFFCEFEAIQFEQGKIDSETLYNLGKFAGISLPRIPQAETRSATRMTESEYDEQLDYEFSERGLFKTEQEDFEFVQKVIDDTGLPDINTLATENKRSSLVGDESVVGYISQDEENVVDDNGSVRPDKVLDEPPANLAYSDFYGNKFLFLAEGETVYLPVSYEVFFELFKALQYVRYNGMNISAIVKIVQVVCPDGLVKIDSVTVSDTNTHFVVSYVTDLTVDVDLKQDRINVLLYIMRMKFPQVVMTEILE